MFSLALAVQWGSQALFQASVSRTEFVHVCSSRFCLSFSFIYTFAVTAYVTYVVDLCRFLVPCFYYPCPCWNSKFWVNTFMISNHVFVSPVYNGKRLQSHICMVSLINFVCHGLRHGLFTDILFWRVHWENAFLQFSVFYCLHSGMFLGTFSFACFGIMVPALEVPRCCFATCSFCGFTDWCFISSNIKTFSSLECFWS